MRIWIIYSIALLWVSMNTACLAQTMRFFQSEEFSRDSDLGHSMAVDGEFLFAGAPFNEIEEHRAGSVIVYKLINNSWREYQVLQPEEYYYGCLLYTSDAADE